MNWDKQSLPWTEVHPSSLSQDMFPTFTLWSSPACTTHYNLQSCSAYFFPRSSLSLDVWWFSCQKCTGLYFFLTDIFLFFPAHIYNIFSAHSLAFILTGLCQTFQLRNNYECPECTTQLLLQIIGKNCIKTKLCQGFLLFKSPHYGCAHCCHCCVWFVVLKVLQLHLNPH